MNHNDYDEIPYTKNIYKQTQPDNLATIAILFGMQPPPVATCRVLELGCASGINLLAMAQAIPQGEFLGIDLSARQIQAGQANIRQLGLPNITLKQMDIMAIDSDFGQFDYIIVHGVYSWVSPTVRAKILQVCHQQLHPQGVAYVSYNVYPGWHMDMMLRKMVLYHVQSIRELPEKLAAAKALIRFLITSIETKYDTYSLALKKELTRINQLEENYFFHEYLEKYNEAVFFHEFIEQVNHYGLQYLADTKTLFTAIAAFIPQTEIPSLNLIEKEQYFDFLQNNSFRETLLCHQTVVLNRNLVADKISDFYIAAPLKLTNSQSLNDLTTLEATEKLELNLLEQFETLSGRMVLSVSSPLLKAICFYLGEIWPQSISFADLLQQVYGLLIEIDDNRYQAILSPPQIQEVKTMLLEFYLKDIVEFSSYPPSFTLQISDCPLASPMARLQSQQYNQVTNLRYEVFKLNLATREILKHLDGTHDRDFLIEIMKQNIVAGKLLLYQDEERKALTEIEPGELYLHLSRQVTEILHNLANKAYLLA
jgi:methyltransferase-like protein/2-polyprenyl-3-methyl-5-hydroxy-6-metoxy-1,4-benzoquinol methylase